MITNITGKIVGSMLPRTGTSKSGSEWVSQDFIIEDDKGDKLCFNVFGQSKIDEYGLKTGVEAAVTVKIDSREWNGKWFTQATCINCLCSGASKNADTHEHRPIQVPSLDAAAKVTQEAAPMSANDLPF